ncbi:MAG TPA: hypothetical protein VFL47_17020 [Flavisolibacter sp.]|nr:hypothetical protein [Flavisolibacter sp.]
MLVAFTEYWPVVKPLLHSHLNQGATPTRFRFFQESNNKENIECAAQ